MKKLLLVVTVLMCMGLKVNAQLNPSMDYNDTLLTWNSEKWPFQTLATEYGGPNSAIHLYYKNVTIHGLDSSNVVNSTQTNFVWANNSGRVFKTPTTYLFPTQTGNSGKFLTTNGSGTLSWASPSPGGTTPAAMSSKSLNTAYQISSTVQSRIYVSAKVSCNLSLSGGQSGQIILEISANGTSGWIYCGQIDGSNTGTLTIGLNTTQLTGGTLTMDLPAGYYWRLRTNDVTGSPTYTWNGGNQITY